MAAPWISSPEMAMRDPGQGGRHRQTWRWSTPARIVGCGDASSRSVATAGDLVPSSAMAMLQLDVRGLVVSASSDAAMLERGEKKPPRGVRGGKSACGSGRKKPRRRSGRKAVFKRWGCNQSSNCASQRTCLAVNSRGWPWREHWYANPRSCSWMNRFLQWTN